jgi:transposase-like protein
MRKNHDKQFKAKVALEAVKEERTIVEIARQYDVHPNLVTNWKKQLMESLSELFERPNANRKDSMEAITDDLFNQKAVSRLRTSS